MKSVLLMGGGLLAVAAAWLAFAPVPIEPVAWDAPDNPGFTGDFAPNRALADPERLSLGGPHGPEDVTVLDGQLYTVSQGGDILRMDPENPTDVTVVAKTGGVPLGLEAHAGALFVADAHKGLLRVSPDGTVVTLADRVDGTPILYADDLDVHQDLGDGASGRGTTLYVSDASTKFGAEANGSTLAASLLEIMESAGTGRVLAHELASGTTRVVRDGYVFSNGIAMHPDGDVLVVETGRYRVMKLDPDTGEHRVWIDGLPGFPDNINRGPARPDGEPTYFLGLISLRSDWLDENADNPGARKLAMRLPAALRPKAVPYGHIIQLDAAGTVLRTFQDPGGAYADATGAIVHDGHLYVTSLHEPDLARLPYPELTP